MIVLNVSTECLESGQKKKINFFGAGALHCFRFPCSKLNLDLNLVYKRESNIFSRQMVLVLEPSKKTELQN